jgi:hypothetical protein
MAAGNPNQASLNMPPLPGGMHGQFASDSSQTMQIDANTTSAVSGNAPASLQVAAALSSAKYVKFTSQEALGGFLIQHYNIRSPRDLSSCEVCHR